jgi:hypothetical protein
VAVAIWCIEYFVSHRGSPIKTETGVIPPKIKNVNRKNIMAKKQIVKADVWFFG